MKIEAAKKELEKGRKTVNEVMYEVGYTDTKAFREVFKKIIGIADDDRAEDAWKQAVEKDGIGIWKHVRRGLKYQDGELDHSTDISDWFGIHTLPTKILIDPEGKIIGRFSEEEVPLDRMLEEIF